MTLPRQLFSVHVNTNQDDDFSFFFYSKRNDSGAKTKCEKKISAIRRSEIQDSQLTEGKVNITKEVYTPSQTFSISSCLILDHSLLLRYMLKICLFSFMNRFVKYDIVGPARTYNWIATHQERFDPNKRQHTKTGPSNVENP